MRLQGWLESLRKWIDGEEDLDEKGEPRPRSKWDDFLVAVAREVEQSMQREMFTPPGGPTYIPREYVVFLNPEDDAEWQGEKREGLERGLRYVLSERARELAGSAEFQTRTLTVELRVDPALERNRFRVQHVWDTEAQKTMVTPRKREQTPAESAPDPAEMATRVKPRDEEATVVRPRKKPEPVFSLSVRRTSEGQESCAPEVRRFFKDEISIGRGSSQIEVDLKLEGDMEVSRKHATLTKTAEGRFTITCHGANPIKLDGDREIAIDESSEVGAGQKILICGFEVVVQPDPAV